MRLEVAAGGTIFCCEEESLIQQNLRDAHFPVCLAGKECHTCVKKD